jgi:hypothetical protein
MTPAERWAAQAVAAGLERVGREKAAIQGLLDLLTLARKVADMHEVARMPLPPPLRRLLGSRRVSPHPQAKEGAE